MISLKELRSRLSTERQGFTIVELLIVIVVIGILAALVIVTYNGIQQKARDTERKTDVKALQGQLEAFWANSAKYPCLSVTTATCTTTDLNDSAFRSANMKGLDPAALADPKNPGSQTLCGTASLGCYGYTVTPTGCDNVSTDCDNYVLTADLESSATPFVVQSNN